MTRRKRSYRAIDVKKLDQSKLAEDVALPVEEAVAQLKQSSPAMQSSGRLREIAAKLPGRVDRKSLPIESDNFPSPVQASELLDQNERLLKIREVATIIRECLDSVPAEDRRLLERRFIRQNTVAGIARELGLPAKPLYRRISRCLARVRLKALSRGLTSQDIREVLAAPEDLPELISDHRPIVSTAPGRHRDQPRKSAAGRGGAATPSGSDAMLKPPAKIVAG